VSEDFKDCQIACLGWSQVFRNLTRATRSRWQEPGMSPATMPPEFFRSKGARIKEKAVDIYSFGVVLFYLLAGQYPFHGPSFEDYKFQHGKVAAPSVRKINPSVPTWLEEIIARCLLKDPDERWQEVDEIRQEFEVGMNKR
jgi:serine/threonine-protein kinase